MTQCSRCPNLIPPRILIDGRWRNLKNRKTCLDCKQFTGKAGNRINPNAKHTRHPPKTQCKSCNKTFQPCRNSVECCSTACANKLTSKRKFLNWNLRTLKDSINHSTPRTKYVHVRKHARRVMAESEQDKKCKICGFDLVVEVCHIKGIAEFSLDARLGQVNALNNLVYLCPNHHAMLDRGLLYGHDPEEGLGISTPKDGVQLPTCSL